MNSIPLAPSEDDTNAHQRRQFEAWAKTILVRDENGEYTNIHERFAWAAWQAAWGGNSSDPNELRRIFEAWSKTPVERDETGRYVSLPTVLAWAAWQASTKCSSRPCDYCDYCDDSGSIHGTDCGACCSSHPQPIGFVSEDTLERLPLEGIGRIDHKPWDEMGRNIPVYTRPLPSSSKPEVPAGPDHCPITGLAFYGNMEHPKRGVIAMYGGPLDVYSLPELQQNDGELRRERYDLDADDWVEGGEPLGYFYREQQPESD